MLCPRCEDGRSVDGGLCARCRKELLELTRRPRVSGHKPREKALEHGESLAVLRQEHRTARNACVRCHTGTPAVVVAYKHGTRYGKMRFHPDAVEVMLCDPCAKSVGLRRGR